jgi:hypothetical protein
VGFLAIKAAALRFNPVRANGFLAADRRWPPGKFLDGYEGILLPVRKFPTEKSGFIGLSAFPGQDSLVYGGKAQDPGFCRKNGQSPKKVLIFTLATGNNPHE